MTARREGFSLNLAAAQDLTRIDNVDVDVDGILITEQHRKEFKLAHQATVSGGRCAAGVQTRVWWLTPCHNPVRCRRAIRL